MAVRIYICCHTAFVSLQKKPAVHYITDTMLYKTASVIDYSCHVRCFMNTAK